MEKKLTNAIKLSDKDNQLYTKIKKNDKAIPKSLSRWKNRLSELEWPKFTHRIMEKKQEVKFHINDLYVYNTFP